MTVSPAQGCLNAVLTVLLRVYLVMLLLGAVHSAWPLVPALGFWASTGLYMLTSLLFKTAPQK